MNENWERFYLATRTLVGPGPIKRRLAQAYECNLEDLDPQDLPESIQNEFRDLSQELHSICPLSDETAVWASVRKMSDRDADRCAETIVQLWNRLARPESAVA